MVLKLVGILRVDAHLSPQPKTLRYMENTGQRYIETGDMEGQSVYVPGLPLITTKHIVEQNLTCSSGEVTKVELKEHI